MSRARQFSASVASAVVHSTSDLEPRSQADRFAQHVWVVVLSVAGATSRSLPPAVQQAVRATQPAVQLRGSSALHSSESERVRE